MNILESMEKTGLIPVVVLKSATDAIPLATALYETGINVIEITLRTPVALDSIRQIRANMSEVIVGAGTVVTLQNAKDAIEAGATFLVTPGYNQKIIEYCNEHNIVVVPGCVTPTEIITALENGITTLKYFPANIYGGIKGCKALYGPFGHLGLDFIPTGGISLSNLHEYATQHFVRAVGGGWLADPKLVEKKDFDEVKRICNQSIAKIIDLKVDHNSDPQVIERLEKILGFAPQLIQENTQTVTDGVLVSTCNTVRADYYLKTRGFTKTQDNQLSYTHPQLDVFIFLHSSSN